MSTPVIHHRITPEDWQTLTLCEQMGNIGSEVSRMNSAAAQGKTERAQAAFERALELIDLTKADPRHRTRLKELCRMREILCDFFVGDNEYGSDSESLDDYFLQFAVAARMGR